MVYGHQTAANNSSHQWVTPTHLERKKLSLPGTSFPLESLTHLPMLHT
jgi:hypothetical protein